jgi:hypothetical protein
MRVTIVSALSKHVERITNEDGSTSFNLCKGAEAWLVNADLLFDTTGKRLITDKDQLDYALASTKTAILEKLCKAEFAREMSTTRGALLKKLLEVVSGLKDYQLELLLANLVVYPPSVSLATAPEPDTFKIVRGSPGAENNVSITKVDAASAEEVEQNSTGIAAAIMQALKKGRRKS